MGRGNVTPSDRSSTQPAQGHADSIARRRSGALSFTSTDSLPADPGQEDRRRDGERDVHSQRERDRPEKNTVAKTV